MAVWDLFVSVTIFTYGSSIKNLTIEGNIFLRHPVNHQRVTLCGFSGGVVGGAYGTTLENCHFIGNITEGYNVGGIIGIGVESSIINCSTKGNITGSFYVGGIAGQLYGISSTGNHYGIAAPKRFARFPGNMGIC